MRFQADLSFDVRSPSETTKTNRWLHSPRWLHSSGGVLYICGIILRSTVSNEARQMATRQGPEISIWSWFFHIFIVLNYLHGDRWFFRIPRKISSFPSHDSWTIRLWISGSPRRSCRDADSYPFNHSVEEDGCDVPRPGNWGDLSVGHEHFGRQATPSAWSLTFSRSTPSWRTLLWRLYK